LAENGRARASALARGAQPPLWWNRSKALLSTRPLSGKAGRPTNVLASTACRAGCSTFPTFRPLQSLWEQHAS